MIGPKGRECSNGRQTMAPSPILMQSPLQTMWMRLTNVLINRQKRPIGSHSERVFVRAKFLDPLAPKPHQSCARTNEPAELEHALARVLEDKEIRLKNNKLRLSAALHRAIHNSTSQNALAAYLRRFTH